MVVAKKANCVGLVTIANLVNYLANQVSEEMVNSVDSMVMLEHLSLQLAVRVVPVGQEELAATMVDKICLNVPVWDSDSSECVGIFVCAVENELLNCLLL